MFIVAHIVYEIVVGGPCFEMQYLVPILVIHLAEEDRAGCFTLNMFLLLCGCKCSVSFPWDVVW